MQFICLPVCFVLSNLSESWNSVLFWTVLKRKSVIDDNPRCHQWQHGWYEDKPRLSQSIYIYICMCIYIYIYIYNVPSCVNISFKILCKQSCNELNAIFYNLDKTNTWLMKWSPDSYRTWQTVWRNRLLPHGLSLYTMVRAFSRILYKPIGIFAVMLYS